MVKHICGWRFADHIAEDQKHSVAMDIKNELEGLAGVIPGIVEIRVFTELMPGSTSDLMLYSVFESEQLFKSYQEHPEHQRVANTFVRPNIKDRCCLDVVD